MVLKVRKSKAPPPAPGCALSECMALLSGAWTPNVIWHLAVDPRRFSELRKDMPRISAKMLSARLKELEARGVVERQVMPTSPPSVEYRLSPLGRRLLPAIQAVVDVGHELKRLNADQLEGGAAHPPSADADTLAV